MKTKNLASPHEKNDRRYLTINFIEAIVFIAIKNYDIVS